MMALGIHGRGHPFSLIIEFTGIVYHGVFDAFPWLRMGFLEGGGLGDLLDGSLAFISSRTQFTREVQRPSPDRHPSEYMKNGQAISAGKATKEAYLP